MTSLRSTWASQDRLLWAVIHRGEGFGIRKDQYTEMCLLALSSIFKGEKMNKPVIHVTPHPKVGQTVTIKSSDSKYDGEQFVIEDWWDRLRQGSWSDGIRNPACLQYAVRASLHNLPGDDEVIYGKIGCFGHLIHDSEIAEDEEEIDSQPGEDNWEDDDIEDRIADPDEYDDYGPELGGDDR